ncbi:MAG: DnaB-like helicase C-terminal domain-containing protein, partial [Candidatus Thorarchaeota archaeon]
ITITNIPPEDGITDPEDVIFKKGLDEFFKLRPQDAFTFFLRKEEEPVRAGLISKSDFVTKMIRIIQNTANRVDRGLQIKSLSSITEIPERDIRDEMDRLLSIDTDALKDKLARNLYKASTPDDIADILDTFKNTIESSSGSREERAKLSVEECTTGFQDLCTILDNRKPGLQGWATGYPVLDTRISGIPKPIGYDDEGNLIPIAGSIIGIAGAPQHCKSTILQNLSLRLAAQNIDISILYWSLDDSRERTLERMLAIHSGVSCNKVTRREEPSYDDELKIKVSQEAILDLLQRGRLVMKDHSVGSTIPTAKRWIEMMQADYERPCLLVIDSFHKIGTAADEKALQGFGATREHSNKLKALAHTHKISIMSSVELNKTQAVGHEPSLHHITETRKIEYDFDVIALVYNEFYDMDTHTRQILRDPETNRILPLIKFNIKKSKEGGCGVIWFAMNRDNFSMECYSAEQIHRMLQITEVGDVKVDDTLVITPPDVGKMRSTEAWS